MKTPFNALALIVLVVASSRVNAALNDPPYFNLWSASDTAAGGQNGNGMTTLLCGTQSCGAAVTAADHNYAIINALTKNTAKGSGNIDPFLRFDQNPEGYANNGSTTEPAFNTNYRCNTPSCMQTVPQPGKPSKNIGIGQLGTIADPNTNTTVGNQAKDDNGGGPGRHTFNHAVQFSSLIADANGYLHFLLDINEPGADATSGLRLDELAFFTSATDQLHSFSRDNSSTTAPDSKFVDSTPSKKIWDMDFNSVASNGGSSVSNASGSGRTGGLLMDSKVNGTNGSGDFDMEVLLHKDLFAGISANDYVYLYNFAGAADAADIGTAGAGFEEWAAQTGPGFGHTVPEPSSLALFAFGVLGASRYRSRARKSPPTRC